MSRDGELTITRHAHTLKGVADSLSIIPLGDIHFDLPACDLPLFRYFLRKMRARDQNKQLYLNLGDSIDFGSISERMALKAAKLHDQTRDGIDTIVDGHVKRLAKELAFTRGRWLGMLAGNHDYEFQDGTTAAGRLAKLLDAPLLGSLAYIVLTLNSMGSARALTLWPIMAGRAASWQAQLSTRLPTCAPSSPLPTSTSWDMTTNAAHGRKQSYTLAVARAAATCG